MKLPSNKTWYGFYKKLPEISSIALGILFFLWAIIDPSAIQYGDSYGVMQIDSWFGAFFIWLLIGAVFVTLTYCLLKITFSKTLLEMEYLESIELYTRTFVKQNSDISKHLKDLNKKTISSPTAQTPNETRITTAKPKTSSVLEGLYKDEEKPKKTAIDTAIDTATTIVNSAKEKITGNSTLSAEEKDSNYSFAVMMFEQHSYEVAYNSFIKIKGYKDTDEYLKKLKELLEI